MKVIFEHPIPPSSCTVRVESFHSANQSMQNGPFLACVYNGEEKYCPDIYRGELVKAYYTYVPQEMKSLEYGRSIHILHKSHILNQEFCCILFSSNFTSYFVAIVLCFNILVI